MSDRSCTVRDVARTKVVKRVASKPKPKPKAKPKPKPKPTAKPKARASKPKTPRPTRPSLPLPPPPPAPPPPRAELAAPRDIGRLLRYGERFGARRIDVRMLPVQLPVASGSIGLADTATPKTWRVLDRPTGAGSFRVMLSIVRDGARDQLAAVVIHVGRPPIVRWTVAHWKGTRPPRSADDLPRIAVTSGWLAVVDAGAGAPGAVAVPAAEGAVPIDLGLGDGRRALAVPCAGELVAYWGIDAADKPVCLVLDLEALSAKDWKAKPA